MSVCEPKVTVGPEATFSAAIVSEKAAPPAGAAMGEKLMMAGAPPAGGEAVTLKPMLFETSEPFATETLTVPADDTSLAGTVIVMVQPAGGDTSQATLKGGESVSLPKRTLEVPRKSVPVIDSVKLPLPAATLVGEMERMVGVVFEGGAMLPPPHPENHIERLKKDPRRNAFRHMIHHRPGWTSGTQRDSTSTWSSNSNDRS